MHINKREISKSVFKFNKSLMPNVVEWYANHILTFSNIQDLFVG